MISRSNNKTLLLSLFFMLFAHCASAQQKYTLSGYVKDKGNGEELIGASVYIEELKTGAITNVYGFYSLTVPEGKYKAVYSYIGYQAQNLEIDLKESKTINVELAGDDIKLKEVEIVSEAEDQNVTEVQMSTVKLGIQTIKKMPAFLGEVDIIRSILLLPGVSTVGEGATGFNVRGGSIDQNLVLFDEGPVYSSSHLFGFFSVFNSDAVKDVKLYKGGIPANFGGRLASVLDIRQKEGNMKKFAGMGGIGVVSSRLTLEGPLKKDKSSFMVAARRSYADVFLPLSKNETIKESKAFFYDLNAKVNYIVNDRNRFFLSSYYGRDIFSFSDQFGFDWGNSTTTLRWNHLINDRLFSNYTLIYSDYSYQLGVPKGDNAFRWTSNIINLPLKADYTFFANANNKVDFGASATRYVFKPGLIKPLGTNKSFKAFEIPNKQAVELGAYISNEQKIGEKITLQYGLRFSRFTNIGSRMLYEYQEGVPKSPKTIIDSTFYGTGEKIAAYQGLEPRFSIKYGLTATSSVKASYNRMRQYLHLISNTTAATPIDLWVPTDPYIKPQIGDQVTLGYFRNFFGNKIEASAEVYYKYMQNQVDYKNGAQLLFNRTLEAELLSGIGRAYGLELMFQKNEGRFTGWLSYTLSRTERQIKGDFPEETINNGKFYASNYDKPHNLSITSSYQANKRWSVSANFVYSTGRPITYPDAKYEYGGIIIPNYSSRNQARVADYHRLDFAATLDPKPKENRRWEGSWTFSIYNVYRRKNPYSISFRQNETNPQLTEAVRISILGTIVPAVTYNFKF